MGSMYKYNDGGRAQDGYEHERQDCTVRSYALAMNISYDESHKILKHYGRRDCKRFSFKKFMRLLHSETIRVDAGEPRQRVRTFLKTNEHRNIIVRVSGHVFCVKNNIALDIGNSMNCIVLNYWIF